MCIRDRYCTDQDFKQPSFLEEHMSNSRIANQLSNLLRRYKDRSEACKEKAFSTLERNRTYTKTSGENPLRSSQSMFWDEENQQSPWSMQNKRYMTGFSTRPTERLSLSGIDNGSSSCILSSNSMIGSKAERMEDSRLTKMYIPFIVDLREFSIQKHPDELQSKLDWCQRGETIVNMYRIEKEIGRNQYYRVFKCKNLIQKNAHDLDSYKQGSFLIVKVFMPDSMSFQVGLKEIAVNLYLYEKHVTFEESGLTKMTDYFFYKQSLVVAYDAFFQTIDNLIGNYIEPYQILQIFHQLTVSIAEFHRLDIIFGVLCPESVFYAFQRTGGQNNVLTRLMNLEHTEIIGVDEKEVRVFKQRDEGLYLRYCSPEFLHEGKLTKSSDMWSLACIIYELYFQEPLFEGADASQLLHQMRRLFGDSTAEHSMTNGGRNRHTSSTRVLNTQKNLAILLQEDHLLYDLLSKMLNPNPTKRLSSQDVLRHPYFRRSGIVNYCLLYTSPSPRDS
eukprot:TRINITY_DN8142_c0_g1_i1.p1 TRINITY_DN8142_c0_g1~~TRINITY_DN8142_c0_g1_i1.p1  ORF type:complete len:502 (-),score=84.16 TRINITY_DN8142_c0_g1_i1:74-1579(-)